VDNVTLSISAPLEDVLHDAASPVHDIYESVVDHGGLVRENEDLHRQLEEMQAQLAEQQNNEQRIKELEAALNVQGDHGDEALLAANVIAQDTSGQKRMIAIDRGLDDGLDEGMVVRSEKGSLVGTIAAAYDKYSWVRLITDPESAVNAQVNAVAAQATPGVITGGEPSPTPEASPSPSASPVAQTTSIRGVLKGDLRPNAVLDLLPPDANISQGDIVVTSGLGGNYPPGILIGTVKAIQQRPESAFTSATVEPSAQLTSLETVLVLTSFKPARLEAP
jgi:rod shape-determining protein MreC